MKDGLIVYLVSTPGMPEEFNAPAAIEDLGYTADLVEVVRNVPVLFAFCLVIALTNLAFTLVIGRMLRLNLEELLLSVNATLGGAPSAAAMASASSNWKRGRPGGSFRRRPT